jgi:hypothetical protein
MDLKKSKKLLRFKIKKINKFITKKIIQLSKQITPIKPYLMIKK